MENAGRASRGGGQLVCGRLRGEPDFLLRWGNRKRPRCAKLQVRDEAVQKDPGLLLRRASPTRRLVGYTTRASEAAAVMKTQHQEGGTNGGSPATPEEPRGNKKAAGNGAGMPSDVAAKDSRRAGGGEGGSPSSSSGGEAAAAAAWPNVVIALTAREKEEDFLAFKGTKLPQRPKKRAKLIQRTLNQVSPGAWLCDLTLERYEVREKKVITKKTPTGLKAMGNLDSESE